MLPPPSLRNQTHTLPPPHAHSPTRHRRLLHHLIFHHQLVPRAYKWPRRMWIEPRSSNLDQCQPQRTRDAWRNLMPAGSQSRRPLGFCWLSVKPIPFLSFFVKTLQFVLNKCSVLTRAFATAVKLRRKKLLQVFQRRPTFVTTCLLNLCFHSKVTPLFCQPRVYDWL